MFPSGNSYNPFSFTNETQFGQSSCNDENPNSRQEEPPLLFSHFPSPFLDSDYPLLGHPVPQHQHIISDSDLAETQVIGNTGPKGTPSRAHSEKTTDGAKKRNSPRKNGKKDRHTKINTAHGLRDRRMRLSLPIARKFFDLQDMLGFDKASKTIEWLFTRSKLAIKELTRNLPQMKSSCRIAGRIASPVHGCSAASGLDQETVNEEAKERAAKGETWIGFTSDKKNRKLRNTLYSFQSRESRDKARARARERTKEKMMIRSLEKQCFETNPKNLENLGFSTTHFQENDTSLEVVAEVDEPNNNHSLDHQLAIVEIIDETFFGTPRLPASCPIFNQNNSTEVSDDVESSSSLLGLLRNWGIENPRMNSIYSAMANMIPLTGNVNHQNPNATSMDTSYPHLQP